AAGQGAQRVHGGDARVRQPGGDLGLADEAVGAGAGQEDLDGDLAVQGQVDGGDDLAHAAAGDLAEHAVAGHGRPAGGGGGGRPSEGGGQSEVEGVGGDGGAVGRGGRIVRLVHGCDSEFRRAIQYRGGSVRLPPLSGNCQGREPGCAPP